MSSNGTNNAPTNHEDRRRRLAPQSRVALPLPLSKPRQKAPPKATSESQDGIRDGPRLAAEIVEKREAPAGDTQAAAEPPSHGGTDVAHHIDDASKRGSPNEQDKNGLGIGTLVTPRESGMNGKKPNNIRTELPPAFVPSSGIPTPQTTDSETPPNGHSQSFAPYSTSRPISTQINFINNNDSGTSSPNPFSHNGHHMSGPPRHSPHPSSLSHDLYTPPGFSHQHNLSQRSNGANGHHHPRDSYSSVEFYDPSLNGRAYDDFPAAPPGYNVPAQYYPAQRSEYDAALSLKNYLSPQSASDTFSDVELQIYIDQKPLTTTISGHKLIWARSPLLSKLILSETRGESRQKLRLDLPSKWTDDRAVREAICTLYGGNLLAHNASNVHTSVPGDTSEARLRFVLAYIAAGHTLGIPPVMHRGIELLPAFLSWDMLPIAIDYAFEDGGKHSRMYDAPSPLVLAIAAFMASALPFDFQLDATASDLHLHRLPESASWTPESTQDTTHRPIVHRASRSTNDPRLTRLRFGDLGGATASPNAISSILISTPFLLLLLVLDNPILAQRLGPGSVVNLVHLLVSVREARREKALKQQRLDQGTEAHLSDDLRLEERVEQDPTTPVGIRLTRRKAN